MSYFKILKNIEAEEIETQAEDLLSEDYYPSLSFSLVVVSFVLIFLFAIYYCCVQKNSPRRRRRSRRITISFVVQNLFYHPVGHEVHFHQSSPVD